MLEDTWRYIDDVKVEVVKGILHGCGVETANAHSLDTI